MLLVLWTDQLAAKHLEAGERALLVRTHQPAITGNIGGENGGELAFGLVRGHWGRLPPGSLSPSIIEGCAFGAIHARLRAGVRKRQTHGSSALLHPRAATSRLWSLLSANQAIHPLPCHRFDTRTRGRSPVR